jgi:hypothetical protein
MRTGIGYTPVMPDVMTGAGVWRLFGSGFLGAYEPPAARCTAAMSFG